MPLKSVDTQASHSPLAAVVRARRLIRERHRLRAFVAIAVALVVVLLPFTLNHFVQGRELLGVAWATVIALFLVEIVPALLGRRLPLPPVVIVVPLIFALAAAVMTRGYHGILWTYPMLLLFHFGLPRTIANVLNLCLTVLVAWLAHVYIGPESTTRVLASFLLTIVATNVFLIVQRDLQLDLQRQQQLDALAGLFDRTEIERHYDDMLALRRRYGVPVSLVLIGVDGLRALRNRDVDAGDAVLRWLSATLSRLMRSTDRLFRYGDAEFMILMCCTDHDEATALAESLRRECAAAWFRRDRGVALSMGIATLRDDEAWDDVAERCESALAAARRAGGDCVRAAD